MRLHDCRSSLYGAFVLVVLLIAGTALAQIPDKFTNLKVFPEDTGKRELVGAMRSFSSALGVRCNYCHVGENPNSLEGYDFASDEKEEKKVARVMMKMTHEINSNLLPETGRESLTRVRCVTCHRGIDKPESLDHILMGVAEEDGVPAAADRYRELREEHYGKGSYNFSASTLNSVAETLAQEKGDLDGAIEVMKLNLEFNPEAAYSHLFLGQLHANKGDKEAAIMSIERCLELEPDNEWAKQMLEKIRSGD
jgi:tetratricopeptide (TPR) repeat protein